VPVVVDADELGAERAQQHLFTGIFRIEIKVRIGGDLFRGLPVRAGPPPRAADRLTGLAPWLLLRPQGKGGIVSETAA
jgi:hypothetical protein